MVQPLKFIFLTLCISLFLSLDSFAQETKVGILMSLSGVSAEAGEDCMRGIDLARKLDILSKLESQNKLKFIVSCVIY